jgi:hypothetical protein
VTAIIPIIPVYGFGGLSCINSSIEDEGGYVGEGAGSPMKFGTTPTRTNLHINTTTD